MKGKVYIIYTVTCPLLINKQAVLYPNISYMRLDVQGAVEYCIPFKESSTIFFRSSAAVLL